MMKIAGVDEAGRGPLVGSVVAAAVILDPNNPIEGLNDSKKLTEKKREKLFYEIQEKALAWAIAEASAAEIDELNILQASLLAMRRAVEALSIQPEHVLVDGNKIPQGLAMSCDAVVGGDALHAEISAASILAKVARIVKWCCLTKHFRNLVLLNTKGTQPKPILKQLRSMA